MDTLKETVRTAMLGYARKGLNSRSHLIHDDDNTILSVVTVPQKGNSFVSLLVRVLPETVVIERDQNDKPLVDALVKAGVPRSQIVLVYAGESTPEVA